MTRKDFIEQATLRLLPESPRGDIHAAWALGKATETADVLAESGHDFDIDESRFSDAQYQAYQALQKLVLKLTQDGMPKTGVGGSAWVLSPPLAEELFRAAGKVGP